MGYEGLEFQGAKVIGLIANNQAVDQIDGDDHGEPVTVVLDKTPFYGEMGGQMGDSGELVADGLRFEVTNSIIEGGFTLHHGHLRQGVLVLGTTVTGRVDPVRRQGIRRAHTATHILHYALQKVLGPHAQQQGSKVDNDLLRFDFPNPKGASREELEQIEDLVNERVMEAAAVDCQKMTLADARKAGATMLFGEKYPDTVRVVSVGLFSKELCGGTHLDNSGKIGLFKILSEESVSAGTRRITALTGKAALEYVRQAENALMQTATALRVPPADVADRVATLVKQVRELRKQSTGTGVSIDALLADAQDVAGTKVIVAEVPTASADGLRALIDQLRKKVSPVAILLASPQEEGKVMLVAGLSRELVEKKLDAVKWVKAAAA